MTLLLCALGFFIYLTDKNKNEILHLRQELRDKDRLIEDLRNELRAKDYLVEKLRDELRENKAVVESPKVKRFVSVIFRKDDDKCYDYFIGNNQNIQVGDFVEVYIRDKDHGKPKRTIAKVVYLSEPDEISDFARSKIKRKADRNKW